MGGRKDAQKNLTYQDRGTVLGKQAYVRNDHSTDYLDVMQKDCCIDVAMILNLSYWA